MATTSVLGLYKPDGSDYVSVERDLNENFDKIDGAFDKLFILENYSASVSSISSGSTKAIKGSDLNVQAITGYTPVAFAKVWTSSTAVADIRHDITKVFDENDPCITLRNVGSSGSSAGTLDVVILWAKTAFVDDQTSS